MQSGEEITLTDEQLDRLADRLAIRLAAPERSTKPLLTVDDVCATLQVSRAWVYENAARLGGVKLGPGPRAPLRFEPERVAATSMPLATVPAVPSDPATPRNSTRRKRTRHLLPVYDG